MVFSHKLPYRTMSKGFYRTNSRRLSIVLLQLCSMQNAQLHKITINKEVLGCSIINSGDRSSMVRPHPVSISMTTTTLQPFNGLFSRTTWVSRYQKGKTNLDFTGARDSEWQWNQLGHTHVCTSLQTDNHASTPPLCFLQAGCPSCRPTNSVKALKAKSISMSKQIDKRTHK